MGLKSLADGKTKVTILPTRPADPKAITLTELEAGIEASCAILTSDYNVGAATSESVDEKALCQTGNASTYRAHRPIEQHRYRVCAGTSEQPSPAAGGVVPQPGRRRQPARPVAVDGPERQYRNLHSQSGGNLASGNRRALRQPPVHGFRAFPADCEWHRHADAAPLSPTVAVHLARAAAIWRGSLSGG